MSPVQTIALAGMLLAAGLVTAVLALRPAPPQLAAALAQLSARPTTPTTTVAALSHPLAGAAAIRQRWRQLADVLERRLGRRLGVSDADLLLTGYTRAQVAIRKLVMGAVGLLMPALTGVVLQGAGAALPWVLPAGLSLLLAASLWSIPSRTVHSQAAAARAEFRAALTAFLSLVGLERRSGGSVTEALDAAARASTTWPFTLIYMQIRQAQLDGVLPWDSLRTLAERLDIDQLRNLADVVATAADGAAIFATLLAEARSLRTAELAGQHERANVATEQIGQPVTLLSIGYILLIVTPAILRLFGT